MNDSYTTRSIPLPRCDDSDQHIDPMTSLKEHSNLENMWKLKIMNAK
ncbi:MAG: hypothetical protein ACQESU_00385 [Halobacteriota archaeon]